MRKLKNRRSTWWNSITIVFFIWRNCKICLAFLDTAWKNIIGKLKEDLETVVDDFGEDHNGYIHKADLESLIDFSENSYELKGLLTSNKVTCVLIFIAITILDKINGHM